MPLKVREQPSNSEIICAGEQATPKSWTGEICWLRQDEMYVVWYKLWATLGKISKLFGSNGSSNTPEQLDVSLRWNCCLVRLRSGWRVAVAEYVIGQLPTRLALMTTLSGFCGISSVVSMFVAGHTGNRWFRWSAKSRGRFTVFFKILLYYQFQVVHFLKSRCFLIFYCLSI